jgi:hypothetical protein
LAPLSFYSVRWFEFAVTFHPEPFSTSQGWTLPKGAEEVSFQNADRLLLHGWFVSSPTQPAAATVIFFHGNGGNIASVGWLGERLAARGFDVLLFDYRGYGKSQGEMRDERDLYTDADAAYKYIVTERHVPSERVVLYGHSLGSAAVADVGARTKCAAVILESGLSSASAMAGTMLPWLPRWLHSIGRNRFDSARKLASVRCPTLIIHGEPDNVVPTENGRALFAAANEPKRLIITPGAGHVVFSFGGDEYFDQIAKFLVEALSLRSVG